MFNYSCILCESKEEWCHENLCTECLETKKLVAVYGITEINKTLKNIYVREAEPNKRSKRPLQTNLKSGSYFFYMFIGCYI